MNKKSINKKGGSSNKFTFKLSEEVKRKILKHLSNSNPENALASRLFSPTSKNGYKLVVKNKHNRNKSIKNIEYNRINLAAQTFMNKFNTFSEDHFNNQNNDFIEKYPIYSNKKQVILKTLEKWVKSNHYNNDNMNGHSPLDHIPNNLICGVKNINFILKITNLVPSDILIDTIIDKCESLEEDKKNLFNNDEFIKAIMKEPYSSDDEFIKNYINLGLYKIFYYISNELKNDINFINDVINTTIDECILKLKENTMKYDEIPEYVKNKPRFISKISKEKIQI